MHACTNRLSDNFSSVYSGPRTRQAPPSQVKTVAVPATDQVSITSSESRVPVSTNDSTAVQPFQAPDAREAHTHAPLAVSTSYEDRNLHVSSTGGVLAMLEDPNASNPDFAGPAKTEVPTASPNQTFRTYLGTTPIQHGPSFARAIIAAYDHVSLQDIKDRIQQLDAREAPANAPLAVSTSYEDRNRHVSSTGGVLAMLEDPNASNPDLAGAAGTEGSTASPNQTFRTDLGTTPIQHGPSFARAIIAGHDHVSLQDLKDRLNDDGNVWQFANRA